MGEIDLALVNWSRAQFALTAMYHWLFVPLTLGLSFLCAFYETIYVKTGNEEWKHLTKFWMTLFGINFAIGVATGIILEFEFGTNWSNYSWMVGDIFGAPLAVEGIVAFFLEATFFAVMFFGWNRVSKGFHLFSTWMVAIGSNLSALWILVANGWMQYPTGMAFNPDNARFEMQNFWEVLFSPVAIAKFTHTTSSSFLVAVMFVFAVSSYYLIKRRHVEMAKRSIIVASVFGLIAFCYASFTGDESAYNNAHRQPMKMAAYEGLFDGGKGADLVAFGILNPDKKLGDDQDPFLYHISIPKGLSLLGMRELNGFVPGINDLLHGNEQENLLGYDRKVERGRLAIADLAEYKAAKKSGDEPAAQASLVKFNENQEFLGYGYLESVEDAVPPIQASFYSFHVMVYLAVFLGLICLAYLVYGIKDTIEEKRWLLPLGILSFFLAMIASQAGWIVAEVGRQPWAIQNMLPVGVATSNLAAGNVMTTFWMFAILFTLLLLAEIKIMLNQIKKGPEGA
ncbi:MAG: cytochrome ubiquinol oxidase subunit I [Desulfofustis sp.]|nr:cytochrome ubiquinol oxidase subunit I [Desulfofustis sp.]